MTSLDGLLDTLKVDEATFSGDAWFAGATFGEAAWFDKVTFGRVAWFGGVTFGEAAFFAEVTFGGNAFYSRATFRRDHLPLWPEGFAEPAGIVWLSADPPASVSDPAADPPKTR